ncbi:hypothetical protein MTR_3g448510 [Medicago truncatula]|uniref:RNase H type-1 domain-containing protein n=1 Tax=Medicago truncatula TaxID=3880 RepID=G7ZWU9_MEDTR|nr:hypothetical protein MTR_3g448510 [Medicago truncatula]
MGHTAHDTVWFSTLPHEVTADFFRKRVGLTNYRLPYALMVFHNTSLVPILMRNRWDKARHRGIQVLSSHTFREGNYCADKLAGMGHTAHDTVWFSTLPHEVTADFFKDKAGWRFSGVPT